SPAGPQKGWGGSIDNTISCGDVVVSPGDIILGDDDGVTVVPLARADEVLDAAQQRLAYEGEVLAKLNSDQDVGALFPSPDIEYIG
ncbi:MAG: RraA family protein, partial [Candidatus Puniceispirillum sp.]